MERITQVCEAIRKKKLYLLWFAYTILTALLGLAQTTGIMTAIVVIFSGMVLEDFFRQTIDMRAFVILFLFMAFESVNFIYFFCSFALGWLIFRLLFLLTTKSKKSIKETTEEIDCLEESPKRLPVGYLPSLGISWILYVVLSTRAGIPEILLPTHEGIVFFKIFFTHDFLAMGIALTTLCLIWGFFEHRLYQAKKAKKEIVYGFGDGDVFVLAAFGAFLGVESLMIVFFLSLIVQAGWYFICFLLRDPAKDKRGDLHG